MAMNNYIPFESQILEVIKHTEIEYTFRMSYDGDEVTPGQFFEVSLPKFGEAPISVSGIGAGYVDLTIRKVGKVTNEIFEHYTGDSLKLRGPYGNGFYIENFQDKELVVIAGGTGLSPVKGVIDYFAAHSDQAKKITLIVGFRSPDDILFKKDLERWNKNINVILTLDTAPEGKYKTGFVTQYIPDLKFDNKANAAVIVVGPPMMMKFSVKGVLDLGIAPEQIWVSYERRMCCGLGKCGHCRINEEYICLSGPVYNYVDAKNLVD
ncbi:anaerobic sulfite reductase subunit AsrB [Epulopiscium sp. 'N.t. morphotype B']|uniref:anaerobic sulfite reductase subunit AsrB n=1 Tax=Candidatus Epulonipiscium viviparus TaxID=420336 RepID=UPI00049510B6